MTIGQQRQRDPYPVGQGWEVAVAVLGGALLAIGLAALLGLGVASAVWGRGWVWPHGADTIGHVLGGLLAGHPARGLPPRQAAKVAAPSAVYACITVCEVALLAAAITVGVLVVRYRRPGDARSGMASRSEAARTLGIRQLRAARTVIRPDLYGQRASTSMKSRMSRRR